MTISRQIGWDEKTNLYWQISKQFERLIGLSSKELLLNISQIIPIINSLTGVNDTTYVSALSTLVVQQGGIADTDIMSLLNQLYVLSGGVGTFTNRLEALNATLVLLNGIPQTTELNAWIQLGALSNPAPLGYELLKTFDTIALKDANGDSIYVLKVQ